MRVELDSLRVLVAVYPDLPLAIGNLVLVFLGGLFLCAILLVGSLQHGLVADVLSVKVQLGRLEIFGPQLLEHSLLDHLLGQATLHETVRVANCVDVPELLQEDLVDADRLSDEAVEKLHDLGKSDCYLKATPVQFIVFSLQNVDVLEVSLQEARHDLVFVVVHSVFEKVLILRDDLEHRLVVTEVREQGVLKRTKPLLVELVATLETRY